jgi:outer membrane murein-binding lipoprotein Lpp
MEPASAAKTETPKVQLGCGTLILIAIIVMIFSGGNDNRKLRKEIEQLNEKVDRIEQKLDALQARKASAPAPPAPSTSTVPTP